MKSRVIGCMLVLASTAPALAQMEPTGPQTKPQFLAAQKTQFDGSDADHDGVVTKPELSSAIARMMGSELPTEMLDAIYKTMDTDGDGKATTAEAAATASARFDKWDGNHDGTLSVEEQQAGMQALMQSFQ